MQSAMRPKGVLLRYKELIREAERDENTLLNLENSLRIIELEKSKVEDPWELITKPTLLDYPVAPSRKLISALGLISGVLLGLIFSLFKEKKEGRIFDIKVMEKLLFSPFLSKIDLSDISASNDQIIFLKDF